MLVGSYVQKQYNRQYQRRSRGLFRMRWQIPHQHCQLEIQADIFSRHPALTVASAFLFCGFFVVDTKWRFCVAFLLAGSRDSDNGESCDLHFHAEMYAFIPTNSSHTVEAISLKLEWTFASMSACYEQWSHSSHLNGRSPV